MKRLDESFYNFLVSQYKNKEWLENMKKKYIETLCNFCHSSNTKTIISFKFMTKCQDCGEYTEAPYSDSLLDGEFELVDEKVFKLIQSKLDIKG